MRRSASVFAVVVLAAALVASATGATGLKRHTVAGQGVSFSVPASWVVLDSRLPSSVVERVAQENPRLAPFIRAFNAPNTPTKFIALDPSARLGFATNVNVVVTSLPAGLTFETYRRALVSELRAFTLGQRIASSAVTIGGARAVRLSYRLRLQFGKTFTVQTLQYAFLRRGRSVVFTYSTLPQLVASYGRTFARSAASIRFSGP